MSDQHSVPRRRRRFAPLLIVAGLASAVVLSLSMTNTFSAFTAAITNSNNTASSGTIILQEVNTASGGATCNSTDTTGAGNAANTLGNNNSYLCSQINKYGGTAMVPTNAGKTTSVTVQTVSFKNTGTGIAQTFVLTPGACTPGVNGTPNGGAATLCAKLQVVIAQVGVATPIYTGTATALAGSGPFTLPTVPAPLGATPVVFTITTYLDNSADNTYQNLNASQPLVWTLSS